MQSRHPRICFTLLSLAFFATFSTRAQDSAKPTPPKPMAADANPGWDVVTVKPSNPADTRGQHINVRGRQVFFLDTTVNEFLLLGYNVNQSQLLGEPDWLKTTKWDIVGVPDQEGQPDWHQMQSLIRKALEERFGLALHHEQRELTVFALVPVKGAPVLTPTSDLTGPPSQNNAERNGRHIENLKNVSIPYFMEILQFHVDHPIIDRTGLTGHYDLKFQWAIEDSPNPAPDAPPGLFTALQEQLGLKLDRIKAPTDVILIDRITQPEAN